MPFSVGFFDTLFGKRITLEIPDCNGNIVTRSVTEKWYEQVKSKAEENGTEVDVVKVHLLDMLRGYQEVHWIIGHDIDKNTALKCMDQETRDLYAVYYIELGESRLELISRKTWESAYQKFKYFKQIQSIHSRDAV